MILIYPGLEFCPPFKLLQIAAVLEEGKIKVLYTDFCGQILKGDEIIKKKLEKLDANIVAIQFRVQSFHRIVKIMRVAKKLNKIVIIIGSGYKEMMKLFLQNPAVDFVNFSRDKFSLLLLLNCLFNGKFPIIVGGIGFKRDGVSYFTKDRKYSSFVKLPAPAWHLINIDNYLVPSTFGPTVYMQTSEGCPYNCNYCKDRLSEGPIIYKNMESSIKELKYILSRSKKVSAVFFHDLTFLYNKKRVIKFCDELIRQKIKIYWFCYGRIEEVTEELLKKLKEANCKSIIFGIESGSLRIRTSLGKPYSLRKIREVFRLCRKFDISPCMSLVLGTPYEKEDDVKKTLRLVRELNPSFIMPHCFFQIPDLKIMSESKKCGYVPPKNLEEYQENLDNFPSPFSSKIMKRTYFRLSLESDIKLLSGVFKNLGMKSFLLFFFKFILKEKLSRIVEMIT